MSLTSAQLVTLKNDIAADPVLSLIPKTPDGAFEVASAYNLTASPDFTVWRSNVSVAEVKKNVVWTEYINNTSVGERDAFVLMLSNGIIDGSDPNVRQGIADIFSGPQKQTTRSQLTEVAKRLANRVEKLFATGTGSTASPATMAFEGTLSFNDVLRAWSA